MTLNVDELQTKAHALRKENQEFAQKAQAEVNALNQQIQLLQNQSNNKLREAQRKVDLNEGRILGLEDLIREMGGTPKDEQGNPIPTPMKPKEDNAPKAAPPAGK